LQGPSDINKKSPSVLLYSCLQLILHPRYSEKVARMASIELQIYLEVNERQKID